MTSLRIRIFQVALTLYAVVGLVESALILVYPRAILDHWRQFSTAALEAGSTSWSRWEAAAPRMLELYLSSALCALSLGLALTLAWRAAHRPEARALAVFLSSLFIPGTALSAAGVSISAQLLLHGAAMWVAVACFLRFATLFPRPVTAATLQDAARSRAERRGKKPPAVGRIRRALVRPAVVWGSAAAGAAMSLAARLGGMLAVEVVVSVGLVWGVLTGVGYLRSSYQVSDAAGRRHILWVVQGFYGALWVAGIGILASAVISAKAGYVQGAAGVTTGLVVPYTAMAAQILASIAAMGVIVAGLGVALLYDGAVDPALALKRTTVYGVLAVAGALLFGVVENVASSFLAGVLNLSEGLGAAVAGAVVALAFGPLKQWITGVVERRIVEAPSAGELPAETVGA
ncbi:MAG TPA: hypothetical protein VF613_19720 [Longimicrobium sp.]|jgi:hypothetical protein